MADKLCPLRGAKVVKRRKHYLPDGVTVDYVQDYEEVEFPPCLGEKCALAMPASDLEPECALYALAEAMMGAFTPLVTMKQPE